MSTKIEWCDATWSPVIGCSKVSDGCKNCYAEKMAARLASMECSNKKTMKMPRHYIDVVKMWHDPKTGKTYFKEWNGKTAFVESALGKPLHWKKPRMIFVCSMSDLFHESVPFEQIDKIMAVMALCPQHTVQILTKRPERMAEYFCGLRDDVKQAQRLSFGGCCLDHKHGIALAYRRGMSLPNLWLGVTIEHPDYKDRMDILRQIPAAKRFISIEPCLADMGDLNLEGLDWVIVGAESGPKSRTCKLEWVRSIVQQCKDAGVPVFVKQIHIWDSAKKKHKLIKDINQFPEDLRIREYPKGGVKNE